MGNLENNLSSILSEIKAMDCPNGEPKIIAVSKKQSLEKIRALHALGIQKNGLAFSIIFNSSAK